MTELNEINPDIIKKINGLRIESSKKEFLKKALVEEYTHRDKQFYNLVDKKNPKYAEIIEECYER